MYGTHSILDQLALIRNQTAVEYGEEALAQDFANWLAAQNLLVNMMVGDLVEFTDVRLTTYGTGQRLEMVIADEYTRPDAQKVRPTPTDIGFPLHSYQVSLQWTRKFLTVSTVADLAVAAQAVGEADARNVRRAIQRALFTPTNNLTYKDRLIDDATIPLRALYNADSAPIPEDEFGNTFDGSTHTHYLARAGGSLAASDIEGLINTVTEHGVSGSVRLYINRAQEAAVVGFANFTHLPLPLINQAPGSTDDTARGAAFQPFDVYNRLIGVWNGAVEVYIKPWIPANYLVCVEIDPGKRVLRYRRRAATGNGELTLVAQDERYPLRAETSEREFGISVWGREQAAVLFAGDTTYAAPAIA